jgi:formylglycine-generating enzyme required for sulfatase activity
MARNSATGGEIILEINHYFKESCRMKTKLTFMAIVALLVCFATAGIVSAKMPTGKEYTNSLGIKFVRVEPGSFEMGNSTELLPFEMMPQDGGPGNRMDHLRAGDFDERPVHKVKIELSIRTLRSDP